MLTRILRWWIRISGAFTLLSFFTLSFVIPEYETIGHPALVLYWWMLGLGILLIAASFYRTFNIPIAIFSSWVWYQATFTAFLHSEPIPLQILHPALALSGTIISLTAYYQTRRAT